MLFSFAVGLLIVFCSDLTEGKKIPLPSSLISFILVLDFYLISVPFQCFGIKVCLLLYKGEWCYLPGRDKTRQDNWPLFRNSLRGRHKEGRGRDKSAKTGKRESIPLPFSRTPYPLPLSIPVTQDTLETKLKLGRVNFRKDFWDCY